MIAFLKTMLRQNGYKLFTRHCELNIVGIRANSTMSNRFDDSLHVFFFNRSLNQWSHYHYPVTTDPGTYWLTNPAVEKGTAILSPGQYHDAYQIGMHRGQYAALVQRKPVTIIRDYDRDAVLDFYNGTLHTGLFGINIHRASQSGTTQKIEKYSAGCQVFADATDFAQFMQFCEKHRALYGNQFTYTLIDQRSKARAYKRIALGSIAALSFAAITASLLLMNDSSKETIKKNNNHENLV